MHSAQGIILKREDFRERDERIILYTKEFGKISVIAKGTKRIEAKLRGNLDIFNFADIIFVKGANFFILTGIDLREGFRSIAENPHAYRAGLAALKTIESIFAENLRDDVFFDDVLYTVRKLNEFAGSGMTDKDKELYSWLLLKKFVLKILGNQGYSITPAIRSIRSGRGAAFSNNAGRLIEMLNGVKHTDVRLTKQDFVSIEDMLRKQFACLFNFTAPSWVPNI